MAKYDPLRYRLQAEPRVGRKDFTFTEIEEILGFALPRSAQKHSAGWWSNEPVTHVQAKAWMGAGWKVWQVDSSAKKVSFSPFDAGGGKPPISFSKRTSAHVDDEEAIVVRKSSLRGGAIRLLEDYCEADGGGLGDAVAAILNGMALERRRQLLERFPKTGVTSGIDSADLVREDRDTR